MNNFEKIKSMGIDEMAEHHALFARAVIYGFLQAMNLELSGELPLEISIKNQRLWLEMEVRE